MRYSRILKGIVVTGALVVFYALNVQAQTGPGGVGNADGSDGQPHLRFWLRADTLGLTDGEPVTLWPDVSGNGNDFEQSVSPEQPTFDISGINGQPSVAFDGSGMSLVDEDGESYINGQSAFTLVSVIESDATVTNAGIFDGEDPDGSDDVLTIRYDSEGADGNGANVIKGGITVGSETNMESSADLQTTSPQMLTMQWTTGDYIDLYANGRLDEPTSSGETRTGTIDDATKAVVGRGPKDGSSSWDGWIAEVFLFSNKLNEARRTIVENALAERYNINIDNDIFDSPVDAYKHRMIGIGKDGGADHSMSYGSGLRLQPNSGFEAGDYALAAHNNATNDVASINDGSAVTAAGAVEAWNRQWYVDTTNQLGLRISFNIPEGIDGGRFPGDAANYVLLYRSTETGNYSSKGTAEGISGGEEVYFDLSSAELTEGYYTLGTTDPNTSPVEGKEGRTWYSLVSGEWGDWETWTLDPSGALPNNPDKEIPGTNDNVVILSGRTVDVNNDALESRELLVEGRLDLQNTQNHQFTEIRGGGRILLQGDQFPQGDASHFVTSGEGEGTVVFYGNGLTLEQNARTFYDVEVNLNSSSDLMTLVNDYTLNGDLLVKRGNLQINDGINTTPLRLDVNGDVQITSDASITVGTADAYDSNLADGYGNYHKGIHVFRVGGDFTNNGIVRMTNQSVPDYASLTSNGAASLVFYGASDNKLICNNTTDIYNLVIDKGSDRTYELELYADGKEDFALFGQNDGGLDETDPAHPENLKALWIANGTLRLTGSVFIPSLTEGSADFTIGERAALVLDGPNVYVKNSADNSSDFSGLSHGTPNGINDGEELQALYPYGKLQVDDGYYYLGKGEAINFRDEAPGIIEVNGGKLEANQIAISSSASSGEYVFQLNGGEVHVTDEHHSDGNRALLHLADPDMNFTMTGGDLYIDGTSGDTPNGINIGSTEGNYKVTGGTLHINSGNDVQVKSNAPFYNIDISGGSTLTMFDESLTALGDVTIQSNGVLNSDGYDLYVAGNFDLKDGGEYYHDDNTTHFIGSQFSEVYVRNTSSPGELEFNNLVIEKDQRYNTSLYFSVEVHSGWGRAADSHPVEILGDLKIPRGEFDVDEWQVDVKGNLEIDDGNLIATNDPKGHIVLNGSGATQTLKGSYDREQNFGHLELDNADGARLLSDIDVIDFTFTQGIMDLDEYNMDVAESVIAEGAGFSASKMFQTNGSSSDGGLTMTITENGDILYPIGTDANSNTRYTPATLNISNYQDTGKVTISLGDEELPVLKSPDGDALSYFWRVKHKSFSTKPTVAYDFEYDDSDVVGNENNYTAGKILNEPDYSHYSGNSVGSIDKNNNLLVVDPGTLNLASYTAAQNSKFKDKTTVFYSFRKDDQNVWTGYDFNDPAVWSTESHTTYSNPGNKIPDEDDIIQIGWGGTEAQCCGGAWHYIKFNVDAEVAGVVFEYPGWEASGQTWAPRIFIPENRTVTLNNVSGRGGVSVMFTSTQQPTINADFGDFIDNPDNKFQFHPVESTSVPQDIPNISPVYPNVRIHGQGTNIDNHIARFTEDVTIKGRLKIDVSSKLLLNNGSGGDITAGSVLIGPDSEGGRLEFPSTGNERTLTCKGDLEINPGSSTNYIKVLNNTPSNLEHTLKVGGDLILRDDPNVLLDFYTNNSGGNNIVLELIGEQTAQFTDPSGSVPEFYRIVMNKQQGDDFSFEDDFELKGPTNAAPKALELISGRLQLRDPGIDLTLSSGGADFYIPAEATLYTGQSSKVRITGDNTGILLDGHIHAGWDTEWHLDGGVNNYIEYTASGNAEIDIFQADFYVGSQIRRSTVTDQGILHFEQNHKNSTIVVGTKADEGGEPSRGVFELVTDGSYFHQVAGAQMHIANGVPNASAPAFNLQLDASQTNLEESSVLIFGDGSTGIDQDMGLHSSVPLKNIELDDVSGNNPKVTLQTVALTADTLDIAGDAELDANGLNLTLEGDMNIAGTYTPGGNTTFFSGDNHQQINGSPDFYNFTKNTDYDLILNDDIIVSNELRLEKGVLKDDGNTLHARGDVWMDIVHNWGGSGNGIMLDGDEQQNLRSTGIFGKLTIDNYDGVYVPTGNTINVDDQLQMNNGVFDIGKNLLELAQDADITHTNPFSVNNMIQTNISFTDAGVKKYFPSISSTTTFIYPIGSAGKYTPVELNIDSKDAGGYIRVKAADERHPTIVNDSEPCKPLADTANVLQYHWLMEASGISGFTGNAKMQYYSEDFILASGDYDVSAYITARLLLNSVQWNKFDQQSFDENNQLLKFDFDNTDDFGISGDYTAGVEDPGGSCEGAIPDKVPAYVTTGNGEWTDKTIWEPYPNPNDGTVPAGGPKGAIAIVEHQVTVPNNYLVSYKTTIDTGGVDTDGMLMLNKTFGHRLGIVEGKGTLQLKRGALPAGIYERFFGDNGGTLEYSGNDSYDVLGEITQLNNLKFSGTGDRRLPNLDIGLYGNLIIDGANGSMELINEHNHALTVDSNIVYSGGSLDAGDGAGARLILSGQQLQEITGSFSSDDVWHDVEINNHSNVVVHDHLGLDGELTFTAGKLMVDDGALVSVNNTSPSAINGYGAQRYVDGDLRKDMNTSDNFLFPVGDMGRYGKLELLSVSSSGFWQARYYNEDASTYGYDTSSRVSPLKEVSGNEFWKVKGPGASTQAVVKIRWDDESILPAETDDRVANLHIAEYLGGQWESKGEGSDNITDNGVNSGTIKTNSEVALEEHVFTLASEESEPSATAAFITQDTALCEGGEIKLVVELSGTSSWTIELGQPNRPDSTIDNITTEKYTISIPNATSSNAGTYTILSVTDANGGGNIYGDPVDVTVNATPGDYSMTAGSLDLCDGETTAIGLADSENGVEYELLLDGNLVQTATGDGSEFTFGQYGIGGLYEVRARNGGCELLLSDQINLAVHPIPDPQPLANPDTVCYDGGSQVTVLEANDVTGAGTSFSWTPTTDLDSPGNANTGYTPTTNPNQVSVTKTYDVEVESDYGCIGTGSIDIELYRRPVTGNQYHVPNNFDQN
jgi:hypothetical protein